jgi:hypothetical protein
MAIRHQSQSDKYPYASPTTPGLYITFRAYIIELICLNVDKKIGPRFWSDPKYWGPKFRREVKGVDNVVKQLEVSDILVQTSFVQIVKEHNIKSLTHKATTKRVVKNILQRKADLEKQRMELRAKPLQPEIDIKKNSIFIDTGQKSTLAKIRETENG